MRTAYPTTVTTSSSKTVWGRVSRQNSLTYSFDNTNGARKAQDVGLDGLPNDDEFVFPTYQKYIEAQPVASRPKPECRPTFSPLNDPAGDNYHFYRGYDYDEQRLGVLERYKRYNGVEGNSLSPEDAPDPCTSRHALCPMSRISTRTTRSTNTSATSSTRFQSVPEDLVVGKNYITDKQTIVPTRDGRTSRWSGTSSKFL